MGCQNQNAPLVVVSNCHCFFPVCLRHLVTVDPDSNLFKFDGNVYLDGNGDDAEPFMLQNVLLRGCTVRNTDWAIGVAIYTGHQTKIMQNTKHERLKRTPIDRMMNIQILGVFIILTAMCTGLATYSSQFQSANESEAWYLMLEDNPTTAGIIRSDDDFC